MRTFKDVGVGGWEPDSSGREEAQGPFRVCKQSSAEADRDVRG